MVSGIDEYVTMVKIGFGGKERDLVEQQGMVEEDIILRHSSEQHKPLLNCVQPSKTLASDLKTFKIDKFMLLT